MSTRLLSNLSEVPIDVDWDATGPRKVELTVVSARHLPKVDLVAGSIDPYCVIEFAGSEQKTTTKKNTYSPDYDEKFTFEIADASSQPGQLRLSLFDWNQFTANEHVGELIISGDRMWDVVRAPPGWQEQREWRVTFNGQYLLGYDRQISVVTLGLRVLPVEAPIPIPVNASIRGPREVFVTVLSARHLPRFDMLGSIDPYCVLEFAGLDFETTTQTKTYTPDWNERFIFPIADASQNPGPLRVTLYDWDRISTDELVGHVDIPADRMWDLVRGAVGQPQEREWPVVSRDGRPVVGRDKMVAVIALRLETKEEVADSDEPLCAPGGPPVPHDVVHMYAPAPGGGGSAVPTGATIRVNQNVGKGKAALSIQGVARKMVSGKKRRFVDGGFDLDLTYITPRLIAMGYPSDGLESTYRNSMGDVLRFFTERHCGRHRIVNLCSEREYEFEAFGGSVVRYPFPDHNPPALELILACCAHVHRYLQADPDNVVGIHCKAGKGRTGLMVVACLLYGGLARSAAAARRLYDWSRTRDGKGLTIISQIRYAHYFEQQLRLLRAGEGVPTAEDAAPAALVLRYRLHTVPRFDGGTCYPAVTVGVKAAADHQEYPLYASRRAGGAAPPGASYVDVVPLDPRGGGGGVRVAGDFHSTFKHLRRHWTSSEEVKMCHFWLHTAMLTRPPAEMGGRARRLGDAEAAAEGLPRGAWALSVAKHEMDKAAKDHRCHKFDQSFRIDVFFVLLEGQAGAGPDLAAAVAAAAAAAAAAAGRRGADAAPEAPPLAADRALYTQAMELRRAANLPPVSFEEWLVLG